MPGLDARVGTVLQDRYRVVERLAEGLMGVVYRGERVGLNRQVAIKFLNETYAASEDGVRRFEVEARAMSRLAHPNCIGVVDFGLDRGCPYLVMDFITGRTLRQILADEWRVPKERAVSIVRQLLAGLAHAHRHGIIHRDVKPENVLLTPLEGEPEHVRIVDFGLAKLREDGPATTGIVVGTPSYMSPEQTLGAKTDERGDQYAVGIILYELLTGHKPFQADSPFDVMKMHRETPPPPLEVVARDVGCSPGLRAVVERALAKAPDERFRSATAFLEALEATSEAQGRRRRGLLGWLRRST